MKKYLIVFKDRDRFADVSLVASQINETETYTAFVTFAGDDEYSCVRFATDTIFRIDEEETTEEQP